MSPHQPTHQPARPPRVSVLVPSFEQAAFLPRALGSLCVQTLADWEAIVIDDGSQDDTLDVLAPWLEDPRLRLVVSERNEGLGRTLNLGLDLARAELVAYLPGDDLFYREHLARLAQLLECDSGAVLAWSGMRHHYNRASMAPLPGQWLQLVQCMHRRCSLRWTERAELESDDLERLFWARLRTRGRAVQTGAVTCEWVDHPAQRHKLMQEPEGGINPFRQRYRVAGPLRFHSSTGNAVDEAAQTATFSFSRPLAKGRYRLALDYTGVIQTQAAGLFSLDYDSAEGKKRALFTQFENSDARRMIPSWDEPAYKASFALQATIPAGEIAVSNMPATQTTTLPDGRVRVRFADSPKMSTYLLFFALGDFERATANVDGTELGMVTRRGALPQAQFALDASKDILREYNDYFGVRYPLPKLDNVAGPGRSQFFSAMENWGAIFSFEYALLLDPAISTQVDRQEIFATAAHEMAHQWWG
ncbi:MAG TPA: hypothetical protein DCX52_10225, partial [Massilia sp.]|nr:hypothetical protein [Massilia sp.]